MSLEQSIRQASADMSLMYIHIIK